MTNKSETSGPGDDQARWDAQWLRYEEMDMGAGSGFDEFAAVCEAALEEVADGD